MVCKNGLKEYFSMWLFCFTGWFLLDIIRNYLIMGSWEGFEFTFISSIAFAALFTLAMVAVNVMLENKSKIIRNRGSNYGKIICEGSATNNGNGGWMFLTENGFEFYPHKVNFNRQSIIISFKDVSKISKGYNYINVFTSFGTYKFIVCKANVWESCINSIGGKM